MPAGIHASGSVAEAQDRDRQAPVGEEHLAKDVTLPAVSWVAIHHKPQHGGRMCKGLSNMLSNALGARCLRSCKLTPSKPRAVPLFFLLISLLGMSGYMD